MLEPPVSRKSVCSGERVESRNVISKPLCVSPEPDSTWISCTASITARGAGSGTTGPTKSWSRTASAIGVSRDVLRQRDRARSGPSGAASARGSTTPFASASRHQSSTSPRWRAASRSRRSPSTTRTS